MATTAQTMLTDVRARITAVMAAQADESMESYTCPDGRSYSRAQFASYLATLQKLDEYYDRLVNRSNRSGNRGPRPVRMGAYG